MEKQSQNLQLNQVDHQGEVAAQQIQQVTQQIQGDVSKKEIQQELLKARQTLQYAEHLAESVVNELEISNPISHPPDSFPNNDAADTKTARKGMAFQKDPSSDNDVWQNEKTFNNSNNQNTHSDSSPNG